MSSVKERVFNPWPLLTMPLVPTHQARFYAQGLVLREVEDAQAYDATKRDAIAQGKVIGDDYQEAKTPFINRITKKLGR